MIVLYSLLKKEELLTALFFLLVTNYGRKNQNERRWPAVLSLFTLAEDCDSLSCLH